MPFIVETSFVQAQQKDWAQIRDTVLAARLPKHELSFTVAQSLEWLEQSCWAELPKLQRHERRHKEDVAMYLPGYAALHRGCANIDASLACMGLAVEMLGMKLGREYALFVTESELFEKHFPVLAALDFRAFPGFLIAAKYLPD